MVKKIAQGIFGLGGVILGYVIGDFLINIPAVKELGLLSEYYRTVLFMIFICLIFGIILYLVSPKIYKAITEVIEYVEKNIQKLSIGEIVYGAVGALIALIITSILAKPLLDFHEILGPLIVVLLNVIAAIIGMDIMIKKKDDITNILVNIKKNGSTKDKKGKSISRSIPKVLDTSVIIDGRIFDICETGFVEGPLVIPNFVLDELRHISDSSDSLKRVRGRRGLDVLNRIQKELNIETQIWEGDFPKIAEVDSKLVKLAQHLNGKVVTNDYNLNKVAEVQGVSVLNINELSNAIKPVVIPGEEMVVDVVKDGKEASQGVAFLDDGTMIVVENGKRFIGERIDVLVTSVLQTAAGRMIFAKPKEN
ncbi:PIN/TRAM domain-containing protein [Clostridium vincentii]|uniref:Putative PIN and TRAM-domain containing protein n=1 Tax=Clostridium vincentii TaxID=52704 RepID=A0A2T0BAK6_9CLOT|nr:PIN/TRAM domain-containing protein [Clostridium vincentii]PRR80920.1 putative PIN and TRAM-domain containing protein precursor [Clostridium vincentii]